MRAAPLGNHRRPSVSSRLARLDAWSARRLGQYPNDDLRRAEAYAPPGDPVDARLLDVVPEGVGELEVISGRQCLEPGVSGTVAEDKPGVLQFLAVDDDPGLADLR